MSAKIVVVAGPNTGDELWIEYEVVRLGADESCELRFSDIGLSGHVLTLRYSDGQYLAYNRGTETLRLETTALEPNGSAVWSRGRTLHLPGGTDLKLETTGDGAPAPRPQRAAALTMAASAIDYAADVSVPSQPSTPAAAPSSKKTGQTIMVGLLFAAVVGILLMDDPAPGGAVTQAKPFNELVAQLKADEKVSPDLWIRFNEAYVRSYRGTPADALAAFRDLRDRIDWEKNKLAEAGQPFPATLVEADDYVKQRIAAGK